MTREASLASVAKTFAGSLKDLLNTTVCDGAYIGVIERPDGQVVLGSGLRKIGRAEPIRLTTHGAVPCWLAIHMRTSLDPSGYLVVQESTFTVSATHNKTELLHYDYERDKRGYPDAHVQVNAGSAAWDELLMASGKGRGSLGKLHLPVGGRRYRPSVEDVIEMLIDEGVVQSKVGARGRLAASREAFQRQQLRAAIRRDPLAAVLELREAGYTIVEPDQVPGAVVPIESARGRRRRFHKRR